MEGRIVPPKLERIRAETIFYRLNGVTQPCLIRCSDGHYYVVKFQSNRFGVRPLINELLAHSLASKLGLPIPPCSLVDSRQDVRTLVKEIDPYYPVPRDVHRGIHFGSRFVVNPILAPAFHHLPDQMLAQVDNLSEFADILAFDIWVGNHDTRQFAFYRRRNNVYTARMIDHSHCFDWTSWDLEGAPNVRPFGQAFVYDRVRSLCDFERFLTRILKLVEGDLYEIIAAFPPEWIRGERGALIRLIDQLRERALRLPVLIESLAQGPCKPVKNWRQKSNL